MLRLVRGTSFGPLTKPRPALSSIKSSVRSTSSSAPTETLKIYPNEENAQDESSSPSWLAHKMNICIKRAKMCTPCPYPTTYVPDVGRLTRQEYAELVLHFHDRLKALWEKVWFGLYQVHDSHGPTHASQLRVLYMGTGMAELLHSRINMSHVQQDDATASLLNILCTALFEDRDKRPVIEALRLYDGIALDNLQYVISLLREYEEQVYALSDLFQFLRQNQVDDVPTKDHQNFIIYEFTKRASPIVHTLCSLDAQMQVLQMDMENEARGIHGDLRRVNTLLVRDEILNV